MSVSPIAVEPQPAVGRVPPHNLLAEESILGAMLLSRDAIATAVEMLGADDFYKPSHGHVFEAICSLYSAGEPADPVTVAEELKRAGLLDAIGGPSTLISLQAHTPATTSAAKYARIIEELALLRRLIGVANDVAELAYDVPEDVTAAVDEAESMVYEVAQRRVTDSTAHIRDLLSGNLDRLEQLYERGEAVTGLPSGYHELDELLSGLQPSSLVVVGARPSAGKTAFALGLASHAALETRRPVLFFSLEMSQLELTQRLLCSEARVDSHRLRNGRLSESDWQKISHAVGRLAEAPLYIDDNPHLTVMEIRAKARRLKSRIGDLGLVVVDYLQLMTGRMRAESRQVEVSEMSRGLKILARELEAPVVALSQLSRGLEMRQDKRPMLADLRESGCLTADTTVVRADTGRQVSLGRLLADGERDIPIWTLDEHYRLVRGVMSHVFPSGTKQVHELRLASGRRIRASGNHPFMALEGWFPLERLDVGDRIAVPRAGWWPPSVGDLPSGADTIPREVWFHIRKALPHWGLTVPDLAAKLGAEDFVESLYANELSRADLARLVDHLPDPHLADLAGSDVWWDTIVGLTDLGEHPVFDASVPRTHNYVANGIVVHNSIEQDADVVVFIYRDELYNKEDSPDRGMAEILVSKHRNGPTGKVNLAFLDRYTKFANMPKGV